MFAAIFITIDPIAGWSFGTSGNKNFIIGFSAFPINLTKPASSAIFISPNHKAIIPISPIANSTPVSALLINASVTACVLPVKTPIVIPPTSNTIHIILIIISPPF